MTDSNYEDDIILLFQRLILYIRQNCKARVSHSTINFIQDFKTCSIQSNIFETLKRFHRELEVQKFGKALVLD
jgi:hypothetical protein